MLKRFLTICVLLALAGCSTDSSQHLTAADVFRVEHIADTTTYYVGLISSSPGRADLPTDTIQAIQAAHLANIQRLAELGLMALAGPFYTPDNSNKIRGLFWYRVDSKHAADTLVDTDPAVIRGRLTVENHPWIGSATMACDTLEGMEGMRGYQAMLFYRDSELTAFDELYRNVDSLLGVFSDTGRIVLAGPFTDAVDSGAPYALFIFSADSPGAIEQITSSLPEIIDGLLTAYTISWYGPVGLRE